MNGYWEGLLEYNRQQEKKEQKKKNMKDFVDTMGECVLTLIIALLIGYALLCVGAYATFADEALTPDERVVALTLLGEARGEGDRELARPGRERAYPDRELVRPGRVLTRPHRELTRPDRES